MQKSFNAVLAATGLVLVAVALPACSNNSSSGATPIRIASPTPAPTVTPRATPTPKATPTATPTASPTSTPTPTPTPTPLAALIPGSKASYTGTETGSVTFGGD